LDEYALLVRSTLKAIPFDLLHYTRRGEVFISEACFAAISEHSLLTRVPRHDQELLSSKLRDLLLEKTIGTPEDFYFQTFELTLPIPAPEMHAVYEIDMEVPDDLHFAVGSSIPAKLNITASHQWAPRETQLQDIEVAYEINADQDSWAITGKKRQVFQLSDTSLSADIILVPLRPGRLLLPKVDILPQTSIQLKGELKVEVSLANAFETVMIVSTSNKHVINF
jgi:hypothetical protein